MRITLRVVVLIVLIVVTALALPGLTAPSFAQSVPAGTTDAKTASTVPFQVQFDIAAGMFYDDNLFWRPVGTEDTILRITPSIDARRESARVSFSSRYRLDSERYTQHSELDDPFAAQAADLDFIVRPNPMTTFGLRGAYSRTHRPGELNTTTGLAIGRQLASVGGAGAELTRRLGPLSSVQAGYGFDGTDVTIGTDSLAHDAYARLKRDVSTRDQLYLTYRAQYWTFYPDLRILGTFSTAPPETPLFSQTALLGWSRRLTSVATLTLEAGPRLTTGEVEPEVTAAIGGRVARGTALNLSYAHTRTAAVGVIGLVDTDRILADIRYRRPEAWDIVVAGGLFRDVVPGFDRVTAYQATAEIRRAITRRVWFVASGRTSFNIRRAGDVAPGDERIRQRSIGLSLQITPFGPRRPRSES
jgi:hypothetical protein